MENGELRMENGEWKYIILTYELFPCETAFSILHSPFSIL
jgi:hypothetical protein